MSNHKTSKTEQGFTFIEVLVGIMMATAFVLIALQGIVIAVTLRVKAHRVSEALNHIQEDLEEVKFVASLSTTGSCTPATNLDGYGWNVIKSIARTTVTVPPVSDTTAVPLDLVNKDYILRRTLDVNNTTPYNVIQINYRVCANMNCDATGDPIAKLYTEVIPDDSLDCQ